MLRESGGTGRIVSMPRHRDLAEKLRDWLKVAKVTRPELFVSDQTRINLRFHDLRAAHVTWSAVRGDSPALIMTRVGHEAWETVNATCARPRRYSKGLGRCSQRCPGLYSTLRLAVPFRFDHLRRSGLFLAGRTGLASG
jgi:hypothetical protein